MLLFYISQHHIKVKILINIYYQKKPQDPKTSDASAAPISQMLLFIIYIYTYIYFFLWRCAPTRVMAHSFLRFLDHIKDTSHSIGLLWTSAQPDAETSA